MHHELLTRQLTHRYGAAERAVTVGVDGVSANRTLGGRPPIIWHIRHLGEATDTVAQAVLGKPLALDGPSDLDASSLGEVQGALLGRFSAMLAGLRSLDPGALERPPAIEVHPAFRDRLRTRGAFLEGHVYHVAYHVGSLAVLRAEFGLDAGAG